MAFSSSFIRRSSLLPIAIYLVLLFNIKSFDFTSDLASLQEDLPALSFETANTVTHGHLTKQKSQFAAPVRSSRVNFLLKSLVVIITTVAMAVIVSRCLKSLKGNKSSHQYRRLSEQDACDFQGGSASGKVHDIAGEDDLDATVNAALLGIDTKRQSLRHSTCSASGQGCQSEAHQAIYMGDNYSDIVSNKYFSEGPAKKQTKQKATKKSRKPKVSTIITTIGATATLLVVAAMAYKLSQTFPEIEELQNDVSGLHNEVKGLKSELKTIKDALTGDESSLEALKDTITKTTADSLLTTAETLTSKSTAEILKETLEALTGKTTTAAGTTAAGATTAPATTAAGAEETASTQSVFQKINGINALRSRIKEVDAMLKEQDPKSMISKQDFYGEFTEILDDLEHFKNWKTYSDFIEKHMPESAFTDASLITKGEARDIIENLLRETSKITNYWRQAHWEHRNPADLTKLTDFIKINGLNSIKTRVDQVDISLVLDPKPEFQKQEVYGQFKPILDNLEHLNKWSRYTELLEKHMPKSVFTDTTMISKGAARSSLHNLKSDITSIINQWTQVDWRRPGRQ